MAKKLTACPKCGASGPSAGYEFILTERTLMRGAWGEFAEAGSSLGGEAWSEPRTAKCIDCGARVSIAVAEGCE